MKTPIHARSGPTTAAPASQRPAGLRPQVARSVEHRSERRKIREQLRRLDTVLHGENEIFA